MFSKINKTFYKVILICTLFIGILYIPQQAYAKETTTVPQPVTDAASSIIHIVVSCVDDKGTTYYLRQGTGFLVGTSSDNQYIITDNQVITPTAAELDQIRKWNGLGTDVTLSTQIHFLFDPDISIAATVVASGTDTHYAILSPTSPINNRKPLPLYDCSKLKRKQASYIIGFNDTLSILGATTLQKTPSSILSGHITAIQREPLQITTDLLPNTVCSGSPLLEKHGYVVGMMYLNGENLAILPVDTIKSLLETLGINYENTDPNKDYNMVDKETKEELKTLLMECQNDVTAHGNQYTKSSLTSYKEAINSAMKVIEAENSTKDDYENSIDALNTTKKALKKKGYVFHIVELILLAIMIPFAFLNIRQYLKSRKFQQTMHRNRGISLNSSKHSSLVAALIRLDTEEVIWLNRREMRIGKNPNEVDYCIENNSAVSRYHAAIVQNDGHYFLIDNHSTNRTCINSKYLEPQTPTELHDEDSIHIANVPFQFRYIPE